MASRKSKASARSGPTIVSHSSLAHSISRINSRRLQIVDTNVSSYDRTDPFSAFNCLLKLLGSLATRVGGGCLKLTPEEHKLSLHLLAIVEPFIGPAPSTSRTMLTRQPTEILDSIVSYVDDKRDLMNLAVTCSRMHAVVVPRHLDYRVIKCKVSAISVWNHLIIHRALAGNVRRLEILDERASSELQCIPRGITETDTDLESTDDELGMHDKQEKYLVAALSKMGSLVSFTWSCTHSPISIDEVWPTLLKCHTLRQVEINDNMVFAPLAEEDHESDPEPQVRTRNRAAVLPQLKAVSLRSTKHTYGSAKQPALSRVKGMLHDCPHLEFLNISYVQSRNSGAQRLPADDLFLFGRWPQLTHLTLNNLRGSLDAASTFLFVHLNIESLTLDVTTHSGPICLAPDSLPRLRELKANKEFASALLACPCESPRPLEVIKGVKIGANPADEHFLLNLREHGSSVRRIELAGWAEMEDIRRLSECAPRLIWLDVGRKGAGSGKSTNAGPANNVMEWATLLSAMPELVTFHGVKFFYEVAAGAMGIGGSAAITIQTDRSRMRKNEEVASVLAWKCPKLRRIDHWEEGGGKVIVLVRDVDREKEKVRWEVRRVKQ